MKLGTSTILWSVFAMVGSSALWGCTIQEAPSDDATADGGAQDGAATQEAGADVTAPDSGGKPPGAWGKDTDPLPGDAVLVTDEQLKELEATGELTPVTPEALAVQAQAAADRLAEDKELVADYVAAHPHLATRIYRTPTNPEIVATADGNWAVPITDANGNTRTVITEGPDTQIRSIATTIRKSQSHDNQKAVFLTLLPLASESCQAAAPSETQVDSLSAAEVKAAVSALVACWKAEALADETPDPATFDEPVFPAEDPAPPDGWVGDAASYEGAASGAATDGSATACTQQSYPFTKWSGRYYVTPVKEQGNRGSCVAFATISAIESNVARTKGLYINLSEQALYSKAKLVWDEEDYGDGLDTQDTQWNLFNANWSIPYEQTWTYNPSWSRVDNEDDETYTKSCVGYSQACSNTAHQAKFVCKTEAGFAHCYYWRPSGPGHSGYTVGMVVELEDFEDDDLDTAKMAMSAGYSVVMGVHATEWLRHPPASGFLPDDADDDDIGGHALHVVRYLSNSELESKHHGAGGGRVMVKNSWGCWGDGGYGYLPAEWVNDHIKSLTATIPLAVGTNQAPVVTIDAPLPNQSFSYGGLMNFHTFSASATDLEDGEDCCTFSWHSSRDGDLGTGKEVQVEFPTVGSRTITVTATDLGGRKSQKSIVVKAVNAQPTAFIDTPPVSPGTAHRGVPAAIEGHATDPNELSDLPCSSLTWTSSNAADPFPLSGCAIAPTFASNGTRTITLTATDAKGLAAQTTRTIQVVDPPLNAPPEVAILNPPYDNFVVAPGASLTLQGSAVDPDGSTNMTYRWTVTVGGQETELGTTLNLTWIPSNSIPFNCGGASATIRFYATDDDGTSSVVRTIRVGYPPC